MEISGLGVIVLLSTLLPRVAHAQGVAKVIGCVVVVSTKITISQDVYASKRLVSTMNQ